MEVILMGNIILKGYLLKDVQQVADLETILYQMRHVIVERAAIAYEKLVKWQVERIVDEIALNQIKRPDQCSILDMAVNEVRRRILYAEQKMQSTEFCLYYGVQVLVGKAGSSPAIYLKVVCPNDIYSKWLKKIPELFPYDINEDDLKVKNGEKKAFWESVEEKYQTDIPLTSSLLQYELLTLHPDKFQYRAPEERAADIAREKVMNQLLSAYACDNQIPPNKLMEYTLQAYDRMKYAHSMEVYEFEKANLEKILPEINFNMVANIGFMQVRDPEETGVLECTQGQPEEQPKEQLDVQEPEQTDRKDSETATDTPH